MADGIAGRPAERTEPVGMKAGRSAIAATPGRTARICAAEASADSDANINDNRSLII